MDLNGVSRNDGANLPKDRPGLPTLVAFPEDVGLMLVLVGMQRRLKGSAHRAKALGERCAPCLFLASLPVEASLGLGARPLSDEARPDRLDLL